MKHNGNKIIKTPFSLDINNFKIETDSNNSNYILKFKVNLRMDIKKVIVSCFWDHKVIENKENLITENLLPNIYEIKTQYNYLVSDNNIKEININNIINFFIKNNIQENIIIEEEKLKNSLEKKIENNTNNIIDNKIEKNNIKEKYLIIRIQDENKDNIRLFYEYIIKNKNNIFELNLIRQKIEINKESFIIDNLYSNNNETDFKKNFCCICSTELSNIILIPCNHFLIDEKCFNLHLKSKKLMNCPICRTKVERFYKIKINE